MSNLEQPENPSYNLRESQPYNPPTVPGQFSADAELSRVKNQFENTAKSNDQMRASYQGLDAMVQGHAQELDQVNKALERFAGLLNSLDANAVTRSHPTIPADDDPTNPSYGSGTLTEPAHVRQEALSEEQKAQQRNAFHKLYASYRDAPATEKFTQLQQRQILNPDGTYSLGDQSFTSQDILGAFSTDQPSADQTNLVTTLNQAVAEQMRVAARNQVPNSVGRILKAVEDSGIQQLRYGKLPLQDILRSLGTLAGKAGDRRETEQEQNTQDLAAGKTISGPTEATGLDTGLARAASILPAIGRFVGIAEIVSKSISGFYENTFNDLYAEPKRLGQVTGQGLGAGYQAMAEGQVIGLNPFDLISRQQGAQIVAATRESGFTGDQGFNVAEGIASIVNKVGISIDTAANFFEEAMREGGESVSQVKQQLDTFGKSAYNLNMSLQDYTQNIMEETETLRQQGAGTAAGPIAQATLAAAPVAYRGKAFSSMLSQIISTGKGPIAAELIGQGVKGITPMNMLSQKYAGDVYGQGVDSLIMQWTQIAQSMTGANPNTEAGRNEIATQMTTVSPFFQGVDANMLAQYIARIQNGRGNLNFTVPEATATKRYQDQLAKLYPTKTSELDKGLSTFAGGIGWKTKDWATLGRGIGEMGKGIWNRFEGGPSLEDEIKQEEAKQKLGLSLVTHLQKVEPKNFFASGDQKYSASWFRQQLEHNAHFNVQDALMKLTQGNIPKSVAESSKVQVTLSAKPKLLNDLFQVSQVNNNAVNQGKQPANTQTVPRYGK